MPNQCANGAVTGFLVTGERPAQDVHCAAEVGAGS
ncbi:alpha/beta hydrolase [Amycolatopsis sp. NPDC004169]